MRGPGERGGQADVGPSPPGAPSGARLALAALRGEGDVALPILGEFRALGYVVAETASQLALARWSCALGPPGRGVTRPPDSAFVGGSGWLVKEAG